MPRCFAIVLRCLLATSLLLGGTGVHADAPKAQSAAATPPCHDSAGIDADADMAADADVDMAAQHVTPDSVGHCGADCRCACMALPMLMPVAWWLPRPLLVIPTEAQGLPTWHSTTQLPSLRPPIA